MGGRPPSRARPLFFARDTVSLPAAGMEDRLTRYCAALAALMLLAGCGHDESGNGVTAEEARQLDEAANMLDMSPDNLGADNSQDQSNSIGDNAR